MHPGATRLHNCASGLEKPVGRFRRRFWDADCRHNDCRDCFAKYMRYRRTVNGGKLTRGFVAAVYAASSRGEDVA